MSVNFLRSTKMTVSGLAVNRRVRMSSVIITAPSGGGDFIFRDGSITGDVKLNITLPAGMIEPFQPVSADLGLLFPLGIYVELPGGSITIIHD